jgi:hypothetical protein
MEQENAVTTTEEMPLQPHQQLPAAMVAIEQSRAVQEIQAQLVIAKRFPRDIIAITNKILEQCKRKALAEQASWKFPRGGVIQTGPSIRIAEIIATCYGNLEFGWRELERRTGVSTVEAFCWDLETNTKSKLIFEVPHEISKGNNGPAKKLTDTRDIYEQVANQSARRLRSRIEAVIPGDLFDKAMKACAETIANGDGEPMIDKITKVAGWLKGLGVNQEMLEKYLGHKMEISTAEEVVDLFNIFNAIKDKQAKRGDFFDFPEENKETGAKAEGLKEKLAQAKEAKTQKGGDNGSKEATV